MYFRTKGEVYFEKGYIYLRPQAKITTNTYMNLFDIAVWREYTGIRQWKLDFKSKELEEFC